MQFNNIHLVIQFYKLKLLRALRSKSLKIDSPVVCTDSSVLKIGREYLYREGRYLTYVKLRNISFSKFFMVVDLEFLEENNRREICDHNITMDFTYPGIWQLWDINNHEKQRHVNPAQHGLIHKIR